MNVAMTTGSSVLLEVKGMGKLMKNLRRVKGNIGLGVERGFVKAANMIIRKSLKIVPVQTGKLQASWFVEKKGSKLDTVVTFGYRGVEYAVWVHEIPGLDLTSPVTHGELFNIKHADEIRRAAGTWRGTAEGGMFKRGKNQQWKFLEQPLRENLEEILKIVCKEVAKTK